MTESPVTENPMAENHEAGATETPPWMKAIAGLCALTVVVAVGRDFFHPPSRAVEVWFGFEIEGTAALVTAPLHWAIFATGAWAFWRGVPWAVPAGAAYLFYAALCHIVWSEVSPNGNGLMVGLVQATALSAIALTLLRAGTRTPRP